MANERLDANQKALQINLDAGRYGTFAEIGAGQEVARWFFRAGGAFEVDFIRAFGGFGEDADLIVDHFGEAPGDNKRGPLRAFSIAQFADL